MLNVGNINWKNTAENLIIMIVVFLVGAYVGYKASIIATDKAIAQLKPTIEKAIDKETITNTITNAIDLEIRKIKKSDTLTFNITQQPLNELKPINYIEKLPKLPKQKDSIRKGFFGRLFSKEKYYYE